MKVGTDAILLGAWAGNDLANVKSILDVGTGTGIIALMMAQRFPDASVTAIDIAPDAVEEASENFRLSPCHDRCNATASAAQDFTGGPYDLIVSNPPWFRDSLKSDDQTRSAARHEDSLPSAELLESAARLLTAEGRFCVVIPFDDEGRFRNTAVNFGFHLRRCTTVRPMPEKPPKRSLLEFGFGLPDFVETTDISVERQRHEYTKEYATLTRDFLLRAEKFT